MSDAPAADPVPPLVRDILRLFEGELANERFGDVDAAALGELAERTRARAHEVDRARAVLDEALAELEQSRAELTRRAEQGLEYARIFAREDAELTARLEALEERRAPKRRKKRRKRKAEAPKKAAAEVAELPFESRAAG
jgi:hypothetical protein